MICLSLSFPNFLSFGFSDLLFFLEGTGEEQTAVTIASVQQASAFGDHNIQYQFRTEGGQVRGHWTGSHHSTAAWFIMFLLHKIEDLLA